MFPQPEPREPDGPIDVFISYPASTGGGAARRLHAALLDLGLMPFLDTCDLPPGAQWMSELPTTLKRTRVVAVLIDSSTSAAHFQQEEVLAAIAVSRSGGSALQVVPIYLNGRHDQATFPLRGYQSLVWTHQSPSDVAARLKEVLEGCNASARPAAPPSVEAWRRHQRERVLRLHAPGLHAGGPRYPLPLHRIFVEVELKHTGGGDFGATRPAAPDARRLPEALVAAASDRARGVVLRGPPGCGKSTLIQRQFLDDLDDPGVTPVLLRCATLVAMGVNRLGVGDMSAWAEHEAARAGHPGGGKALLSDKGRAYRFLLDGYDEIQTKSDREAVATWLAKEIEIWDDSQFVLTTRDDPWSHDLHGALEESLVVYHVLGLTPAVRDDYVRRWFPLVAEWNTRAHDAESRARDVTEAERMAEALVRLVGVSPRTCEQHPQSLRDAEGSLGPRDRLARWTGNPLMLSIVCLVFRENGRLPNHRGALYEKGFEVLVRGHVEGGRQRHGLEPQAGRVLLGPLAWKMQTEGDSKPLDEVLSLLAGARERDSSLRERTTDELLQVIVESTGLLLRERDGLAFLHPTFREYLAFEYARMTRGKPAYLATVAGDQRWREPILLGQMDRSFQTAFYEALLAVPGSLVAVEGLVRECASEEAPPAGPFVEAFARAARLDSVTAPRRAIRLWASWARLWRKEPRDSTPVPLPGRPTAADLRVGMQLFGESPPEEIKRAAAGLVCHRDESVSRLAARIAGDDTVRLLVIERLDMELVWVGPGTFLMGATPLSGPGCDPEADPCEGPVHTVTLTRGFWLGRFPVTNGQYRRFLDEVPEGPGPPASWRRQGFDDSGLPVTGVSWADAHAYCQWASSLGEGEVRLPTEAEWERAARPPGGGPYPWGSEPAPSLERAWYGAYGWHADTSRWKPDLGEHRGAVTRPARVGDRPAGQTWCGAEEMAGNVWEWCQDGWRDDYRDDADGAVDPCGPAAPVRVARGGSWVNDHRSLRCTSRIKLRAEAGDDLLGFRVVYLAPRGVR